MYAKTANDLRQLIADNPHSSPSSFLMDDSFAAWCYDNKSLKWLETAFDRDADPETCRKWGLTHGEWRVNIEMAILALSHING